MRRYVPCIAVILSACVTNAPLGPPYAAVMKPAPVGEDRIYLLAAIPGRIAVRSNCVLFERLDGRLVLPVFEAGTLTGRDNRGAWLYDPVSKIRLRDGDRVQAGGGGGETRRELARRNVLQHAIPSHCAAAMEVDYALVLNPGIKRLPSAE